MPTEVPQPFWSVQVRVWVSVQLHVDQLVHDQLGVHSQSSGQLDQFSPQLQLRSPQWSHELDSDGFPALVPQPFLSVHVRDCVLEQAHADHSPHDQLGVQPLPPAPALPPCPMATHAHDVEHSWPAGQVPQSRTPEHPSLAEPQLAPSCAHVFGEHVPVPHWLGPPPPHSWPAAQVPHEIVPPQVSGTMPHAAPSCRQVFGVHASWPAAPALAPEPPCEASPALAPEPPCEASPASALLPAAPLANPPALSSPPQEAIHAIATSRHLVLVATDLRLPMVGSVAPYDASCQCGGEGATWVGPPRVWIR